MPEFAPGFDGANGSILPKPTNPLVSLPARNALVASTIGAAPGGASASTKTRIKGKASTDRDGNLLEVQQDINRVSAAGDVTAMKNEFTRKTRYTYKKPSFGFVRDLSGNGGAAFTRT